MASLVLDPHATLHTLLRDRMAVASMLERVAHPTNQLAPTVRAERLEDLRDALRVHDAAIERLYARPDGRPAARGRRARRGWRAASSRQAG